MGKYVYFFSKDFTEGKKELKDLLGGKGANLAEMCNLKLPIPPGFTITTEVCDLYYKNNMNYPGGLEQEVQKNLERLENLMGKKLGDKDEPLLVSVRSGAAVSMPGMMDTILNLGLNDITVEGLAKRSNNDRFVYDSYRRFIQMFGNVVLGIAIEKFEEYLDMVKMKKGVVYDLDLDLVNLKEVVFQYKNLVKEETGEDFPQDPKTQLWKSINAVFGSWNNPRAIKYRKLENITELKGTAVNVQSMVFGNLGETSGTGVAFSRDPSTGENTYYGEYLMNAQGEDVVAGIRTPHPIENLKKQNPGIYKQLIDIKDKLEHHYTDMQDIEFTIQDGELFILQTRSGKRTGFAAVKIAVDMVHEGLIGKREAIMRVKPGDLNQIFISRGIDPSESYIPLARGLPAFPGVAIGEIVFSAEKAEHLALAGRKVILVRKELSPEDIGGMNAAQGILTSTGGMESHAAVVARGMGKCCVVGCGDLVILPDNTCKIGGQLFKEGDIITLDGSKGEVIGGVLKLIATEISGHLEEFMVWVDEEKPINVRTNADTPHDSEVARKFGAEGIGLCRTEHMFFEGDRSDVMRELILADDKIGREKALNKILPMQLEDFIGIFGAMDGYPVAIRFMDPHLHDFIPHTDIGLQELAETVDVPFEKLKSKVEGLKEFSPMLGHRGGCRLAITYPEIVEMQTEAVIQAALAVKKKGVKVFPEIMIALTGTEKEFEFLREVVMKKTGEIFDRENDKVDFLLGTMIETPRACLVADKIADMAQFFSFGTNDLTQMTFGYSRDDAGIFLPEYLAKRILPADPFLVLDREGVGQLVELCIKKGRSVRPELKVGVPIARLAAAQANIRKDDY
jgi:pyruvate,orthophosphate dikinase